MKKKLTGNYLLGFFSSSKYSSLAMIYIFVVFVCLFVILITLKSMMNKPRSPYVHQTELLGQLLFPQLGLLSVPQTWLSLLSIYQHFLLVDPQTNPTNI